GDDFPDAFDAVIAIENVTLLENGGVILPEKINASKGFNVKPQGADVRKGSLVCPGGRLLSARELAAIAMGGIESVPVVRRPRVAFLPTGSELVSVGAPLERGQNFDTNSILVGQLLREMGAEPILHSIVKDERESLRAAMKELLPLCDILLVNAGTSKGGEDYCAGLLAEIGDSLFHGVAAVPGRPLSAAVAGDKLILNLAGPSFAAYYNMDWAVRPLICGALGVPVPERTRVRAVLSQPLHLPPFFSIMMSLRLKKADHYAPAPYTAEPLSLRGSSAVGSSAVGSAEALTADALYISSLGEKSHNAGEVIEVELLRNPAELND
ncbi:MAG: molybdopterin molybdotransferase MoeA, partial [Lachnospiraceae bacterium]|nr:molybdopterin molybdotransferase MoeA [Lachnospiraceae bacterium]